MGSNKLLSHKSYPVSMKFMGSPEFNGHNNSTWFMLRDNEETAPEQQRQQKKSPLSGTHSEERQSSNEWYLI